MTRRSHLFPYRTQKLSFSVPMVLGWTRPGRVGRRRILFIFLSSSMAEHSAVNRVVVGSSPTWGAKLLCESTRAFSLSLGYHQACKGLAKDKSSSRRDSQILRMIRMHEFKEAIIALAKKVWYNKHGIQKKQVITNGTYW